jgi:hypothetical protein
VSAEDGNLLEGDPNVLIATLSQLDQAEQDRDLARREAAHWKARALERTRWQRWAPGVGAAAIVLFVCGLLWLTWLHVNNRADAATARGKASLCLQARDHLTVEAAGDFLHGMGGSERVAELDRDRARTLYVTTHGAGVITCRPDAVTVASHKPKGG